MSHKSELQLKGWTKFRLDNDIVHWTTEALPYCRMISEDKKNIKNWIPKSRKVNLEVLKVEK